MKTFEVTVVVRNNRLNVNEVKEAILKCVEGTGARKWTVVPLCDVAPRARCTHCVVNKAFGVTCYGWDYQKWCVNDASAPLQHLGKERVELLGMMFAMLAAVLEIDLTEEEDG